MTLFLLSIWCVGREFIDAVDSLRHLSLCIHWRYHGLQLLCFRRRFLNQQRHDIFDNSMRQPGRYCCYWFDASVINSLTLSIPYESGHSVFIGDFKVYSYSVFAGDLWISRDITFMTIPYVSHDLIFAIDLMRRLWIHWCCQLHTSAVTQYSSMISRSTVALFSPSICGSAAT
jgi:hypothetical protein